MVHQTSGPARDVTELLTNRADNHKDRPFGDLAARSCITDRRWQAQRPETALRDEAVWPWRNS